MFNTILFGKYLSSLRKEHDLTQSEVADKLNLTRQAISRYETGDSFPDVSILVEIANVYEVSLTDLINSGYPTIGESIILNNIANNNSDIVVKDVKDLENLAPLIKPSVLEKLTKNLADEGIDISSFTTLANYLNDDAVVDILCSNKISNMNNEFIEKLIPFLDSQSRIKIFDKILHEELDWRLIRKLVSVDRFLLYELVEASIMDGILPFEALSYAEQGLHDANNK